MNVNEIFRTSLLKGELPENSSIYFLVLLLTGLLLLQICRRPVAITIVLQSEICADLEEEEEEEEEDSDGSSN